MKEEELNIGLKKNEKPVVPENFFENFQTNLFDKIADNVKDIELPIKTKKPEIPSSFFDDFQNAILTKIDDQKIKPLFPRKLFFIAASIAAILLIGIFVLPNLNSSNAENEMASELAETNINEEIHEVLIEDYLAYIDESTLYDYCVENEVSLESTVNDQTSTEEEDAIIDYLGTDFEDIYFDL